MSIRSKFFTKWGENLFRDNEPELALKMFDRAIKADPKDWRAYIGKVGILTRAGYPEEAIKILDQALEANPKNAKDLNEIRQTLIDFINENKN